MECGTGSLIPMGIGVMSRLQNTESMDIDVQVNIDDTQMKKLEETVDRINSKVDTLNKKIHDTILIQDMKIVHPRSKKM